MALSSTTSELSFVGNNSNSTPYALTGLRFDAASWLTVIVSDPTGSQTLVNGVDYTITGDGAAGTASITTTDAWNNTVTVTATRNAPLTQTLDLENNVPLDHDGIESALDKITMGIQDARREADQNVEATDFTSYSGVTSLILPDDTTISAFGATLVDDTGASAARSTLGLGTIATQAASSVAITGGTIAGITDLALADGGTGASTAAGARTNLGLDIGTDVQAFSSVLAATTASFTTADESKLDGIEAAADVTDTTNVTAAGALMDSEVSSLSGIKTLTVPDSATISTFGATLIDDADAATARATLELGAAALVGTSTGGNGTSDAGKAVVFGSNGGITADGFEGIAFDGSTTEGSAVVGSAETGEGVIGNSDSGAGVMGDTSSGNGGYFKAGTGGTAIYASNSSSTGYIIRLNGPGSTQHAALSAIGGWTLSTVSASSLRTALDIPTYADLTAANAALNAGDIYFDTALGILRTATA